MGPSHKEEMLKSTCNDKCPKSGRERQQPQKACILGNACWHIKSHQDGVVSGVMCCKFTLAADRDLSQQLYSHSRVPKKPTTNVGCSKWNVLGCRLLGLPPNMPLVSPWQHTPIPWHFPAPRKSGNPRLCFLFTTLTSTQSWHFSEGTDYTTSLPTPAWCIAQVR